MALNLNQQIFQAIKNSQHCLITFRKNFTVDSVASSLAFFLTLKKMDKLADVTCDEFELPKNLKFLPNPEIIKPKLSNLQKFIISLDIKENDLDQFSYNIENEKLNIYLSPKNGSIDFETLKTSTSKYRYDLIFVIDAPDLQSLENLYHHHRDFFYDTTIINIDCNPENEHFGQINLTNPNAVSTSEILFDLIESFGNELIDPEIATCLLTGMIAKTNSFKTPNVTPKALNVASRLIAANADRQTIVKSLFRSQSLANLNLWGRALARLRSDLDDRLIWSLITDHDFVESKADANNLAGVINELISTLPKAEIVVLIYQQGHNVYVLVNVLRNHNALSLTQQFNPQGSKIWAKFSFDDKSLVEVEREVIEEIKRRLQENNV
jgi:nanoRNase/pAp phosphatase (c-di-AMP/oligoRNAs hydrolase)